MATAYECMTLEQMIARMKHYHPNADASLVERAYAFAERVHGGQRRLSGEPYIIHPVYVASILTEIGIDAPTIAAGLLHDTVEDCKDVTLDVIRQEFGEEVAMLVDGVTKLSQLDFTDREERQAETLRKMILAMGRDIRVVLIKLADRLHNMRTLKFQPVERQVAIARETLDIYAPLAHRLGVYTIKAELEDLSLRYIDPEGYQDVARKVGMKRAEREENIKIVIEELSQKLKDLGMHFEVAGRPKHLYSIWRKMQSVGCDFEHMDSKHYLRIIYKADGLQEEKKQSLHIYAVLSDSFKERPCSVVNYINAPKENSYQSFHVKFLNPKGQWEEVHISSERMIRNNRLGCTAERTEENLKTWLEKFKAVLKDIAYHTNEMDYMDGVTASFYHDNIMTFTPKGKCIILPKHATALDFAFEIHTEVGLHAVYARINGKLSSVKTVLHRGDCVEIGTSDNATPEADWQNHVLTYKAKRSLGSFFKDRPKMEYKRCTCCHPLPGDEVIGFKSTEGQITLHKRNCLTAIRQASKQGDTIVEVDFKENEQFLFPVRICICGIDCHHLLSDVVACITEQQNLSISKLQIETKDRIVEAMVDFEVHSSNELQQAIDYIRRIKNVDEVARVDIE